VPTIAAVRANPPAIPLDTSPEAWRLQMAATARRTIPERIKLWEELNLGVIRMLEDAVRRRHPGYDDRQVFLAMVRRYHGDELALEVWPEAASIEP
jgi:hypothetical protein